MKAGDPLGGGGEDDAVPGVGGADSEADRARSTVDDRVQPIRSAITVAGIAGNFLSSRWISCSKSSTTLPGFARRYLGGPSAATAARTVLRATPS